MAKTKQAQTYQQMSDELSGLLDWFESDQVTLDEASIKYEQAMELLGKMEIYLKTAENKVKKISAKFDGD